MSRRFFAKVLWIFCAALAGYIIGWILGWTVFDPELDIWALLAAAGGLAGMVFALVSGREFRKRAAGLFGTALGLYPGWVLRTLLFGDVPGGWGLLLVLCCGAAGGLLSAWQESRKVVRGLTGALLGGFFGGLLLELVWFGLTLEANGGDMILLRAPGVLAFGVLGTAAGIRLGSIDRSVE
ncbi:MAG: hypothetical protein JXA25_16645 [Anaerolineales bacterium]|nr:hypothetical protein [Anaerolineales bacterium]